MTARVRTLSHTADVGFSVEASSLDELFAGAARGLSAVLLGRDPDGGEEDASRPRHEGSPERMSLARPDLERLLVAWLRELLHRAQTTGQLPEETRIQLDEGPSLEAGIRWSARDRRSEFAREIKGVTYHGLRVVEEEGAWRARVVLDV